MSEQLRVIFGAVPIGNDSPFIEEENIQLAFSLLEERHVDTIDTAQLYGKSEQRLGEVKAGERFLIDTKWLGGWKPGSGSKENIIRTAHESLERLGVKQVNIFYIHSPDAQTPIEETLEGVNQVYQAGLFKRFGLSNFTAADVEEVYTISKSRGWVLPSVYQGNYSPVARLQETLLFPTLRRLGIAFYAYSPLAGGFLTKTAQQVIDGVGRFADDHPGGNHFRRMFNKPAYLEALTKWEAIAAKQGCTRAELAYRWVAANSGLEKEKGDAIVIGASSVEQLRQTLESIERGKLSENASREIDEIWERIKREAALDVFNL